MILKDIEGLTKESALHRMIDGEKFYNDGITFSINYNKPPEGGSEVRFECVSELGTIYEIKGFWKYVHTWKQLIEQPLWTKDVSNKTPLLCWVTDDDDDISKEGMAVCVVGYNSDEEYCFLDSDSCRYKYARPVQVSDVYVVK